jgi:ribose transport system permease protein
LDGLNYTITNQLTVIKISRDFQKMFNVLEFKILVLIVFSLITYYLYRFTRFGKESRAIGAGEIASRQSGINIKSVKMMAFIYTGLTAALFAFMAMMKTGGGGPTAGSNVGFNIMIAMVLGGSTTEGGLAAKFKSCFIGSLIITVLTNSLSMIGINSMLQEVIKGLIFVLVVAFSTRLRNKFLGNVYVVRKKAKESA